MHILQSLMFGNLKLKLKSAEVKKRNGIGETGFVKFTAYMVV